ncbi:MAG: porin [Zoogloeaceae bacterium]|nr:porin [Zoogloeaceae bacterium]
MQKKLITLAVAALASSTAFAQSNVSVYGSIDVGFSHRGDNVANGIKSKNAIDSGISAGNRLGFKGTEDLGNGVKAVFTVEAGYAADTGEHTQGGRLFGRQAFVGLTGDFGTAIAGRLYAPHYSFLSALDPFKAGMVGMYRNVFAADVTVGGENLFDPTRVDNTVAYVSPNLSGFSLTAAYSNNALLQENAGNSGDNRVYVLLPRYTNGPIDIGLNIHRIKSKDSSAVNINNYALGGSYDFRVAKVAAFYDQNKWKDYFATNDLKLRSWLLGVTVPFGKHALLASYTQSKLKTNSGNAKARQWALGYTYTLSKRTNIYAAVADITNDKKHGVFQRTASVGDSSNGGSGYQNGVQFGLKHTF